MAYIWENYSSSKKFLVGKKLSPYMEIFSDAESDIQVNPLIRFANLYCALESANCSDLEIESLENIFFHYLASFDLLKGIDKKQITIDFLNQEMQDGHWGTMVKDNWNKIGEKHQEIILHGLYMKLAGSSCDDYFLMTIQRLFSVSSLIYEKSTNIYYLYIGESKTNYKHILMNIVVYIFWRIQDNIEIVWKKHYGIIGSDDTMNINEILIL